MRDSLQQLRQFLNTMRGRLTAAFLTIGLIPVIVIAAGSYIAAQNIITQQVQEQLAVASRLQATRVESIIETLAGAADFISTRNVVRGDGTETNNRGIPVFADTYRTPNSSEYQFAYDLAQRQVAPFVPEGALDVLLLNTNGIVVYSHVGLTELGQDETAESWYGSAISDVVFDEHLGTNVVIVTHPIVLEDQTLGTVVVQVDASVLSTVLEPEEIFSDSATFESYLVNNDNLMITESRFLEGAVLNQQVDTLAVQRARNALSTDSAIIPQVYSDYVGVPVLGSAQYFPDLGWTLVSEFYASEAFAPLNFLILFIVVASVLLIGLVAVLAYNFAGQISHPITQLTERANTFSAGDLSVDLGEIKGFGEINQLSSAFGTMTKQLAELVGGLESRIAARTADLETAADIASAANEVRDVEDLLSLTVNLVRDRFNFYYVQVYMVDNDHQYAVLKDGTGYVGRQLLVREHKLPLNGKSLVAEAIRSGKFSVVQDTSKDPNFLPNDLLPDTKSELTVPLRTKEAIIGALDIQHDEPNPFDETALQLFEALAEQLAVTFENVQLFADTQRRARELETVAQVSAEATSNLNLKQLLWTVSNLTRKNFGLYHAHVYLLDQNKENLVLAAGAGDAGREMVDAGHSIPLNRENSLVARAARTKEGVISNDVTQAPDFLPNPLLPDTRSEMAIPIIINDEVLGVLDVQADVTNRFNDEDVRVKTTLASQIAVAINNASLFEQSNKQAQELSIVAEVSARASTELDSEKLIQEVAHLTQQSFDLYHIHIYIADEAETELVFVTGDGRIGCKHIGQNVRHNIQDSNHIVAQAARERESIVDNDVLANPDFEPDPNLPNMRARLAIPFLLADKLVGVLEVHNDVINSFTDKDVQTFGTLAGQIAVAINNARLFTETQRSQGFLNSVVNASRDWIFVKDRNFHYVMANESMANALRTTVDKMMGKDDLQIGFSKDIVFGNREKGMSGLRFDDQHVLEGNTIHNPHNIVEFADGTVHIQDTYKIPLKDDEGNIYGILGYSRDVTEQFAAMEQIQQQSSIIETSNDFIALTDMEGHLLYINPAGLAMLGMETWEGTSIPDYHGEADYQHVVEEGIPVALREGLWRGENTLKHVDGHLIPVSQSLFIIRDDEGNPKNMAAIMQDISERKAAEAAVQKRASELATVAEVSAAATTNLNVDELLWSVTNLTKDNFDLYHAHVYLLDEAGENLVLAAGAGDAGREMVSEGHRIPFDREHSLVARAARTREGVIVNDVTQAPDFMPNPYLPETKAEMAVPMIVGDELLGVLDVQANITERFTNEDVQIKTTLASQIAVAVNNARLFEAAERARHETERLYETSIDMMGSANFDGYFVSLNPAWKEVLGWELEELMSEPFLSFVHADDIEQTQAEAAKVNSGIDVLSFENRYRCKDGSYKWLAWVSRVDLESGLIHFVARDVTQDKDASLRMQLATSAGGIGIWDYNVVTNALDWDDRMYELYGVSPDEFSGAYDAWQNGLHPDDSERSQAELQAALRGEGDFDTEFRVIWPDQTVRHVKANAVVIRNSDGTPLRMIGVNWDITASKLAEEAIDSQRRMLNAILSNIPSGIFVVEAPSGKPILSNARAEELLGRGISPDAVSDALTEVYAAYKAGTDELYPTEETPIVRGMFGETKYIDDMEVERPDGTRRLLEVLGAPIYDEENNIVASVVNFQDITERREQAEAIKKRAAELATVAQVSTATTTILNVDELLNSVVELTKSSFNLYHAHIYLLDEAETKLVLAAGAGEAGAKMLEAGHSIPIDRENSLVARAARTHEGVIANDVAADPHFLPNPLLPETRSEMAIPLVVGDELLGVLDVQASVINRFTDEDVRIKTTLASQVAVAVRNALAFEHELQTIERLREVDRLKQQFLANMSHELRTPLNSIIGYSEVLLDGVDGDLEEDAVEDVEAIHDSGKHLLSIINEILDLAKIEAGQMQLDQKERDITELLNEIVKAGQILVKDKPVNLELIQHSEVSTVFVDIVRMRQVMWNLVSNAVKFTEEGSVEIHLGMTEENRVLIEVRDTGMGISEEDQAIVFERFRQADGSTTRRAGGTGLGLTITRQLIQMHGGDLRLESELGKGSNFYFSLPVYEAAAVVETAPATNGANPEA